jgi:N12 class adenine-specific DNA methylase
VPKNNYSSGIILKKRIKTLIHEDRYLNSKEIEEYPKWLDEKDQEREFIEASNNLAEKIIEEPTEEKYEYQYHLGDRVYIGADEYEILSIGISNVVLYDFRYPLFNREMSKEEFDRKVQENPANDHLKVKVSDIKDNINEESSNIEENVKEEISLPIEEEPKVQEENIVPVFEKKKSNKIKSFDIHPEISTSDRNQFKITNDNLGEGSPREKFNNNVEAIRVLKKCEEENRFATPQEQEILSKYVGWGGLPQAFDEKDSSWSNEYSILKNLLDEKEYSQARESTLTAFYTPPVVIRSMYKALENMGLKTGNILEPSCGVGNFIGMLPDSLEDCKLYGVELDSISGRIARQLYQKSTVAVQGYEDTNLPNSFFDVAVGNVPFGDFKVLDKKYDKHKFLIHDYFFAKTLDKVRPGGVIAFITSKGTLDKENPSVRKYIAQRADLLGAIRLPNNTFKANAGTEVTSDIIFLQKRDSITDIEPDWVYLGENDDGIKMNQYFIDNPEMILGNMEMISTRFGYDSACISDDEKLEDKLERAISNIHAEVKEYELDDIGEEDNSIEADLTVRNFSYTLIDDKIYFRENSRMYPQELAMTTENRVKGLIEIRDCVRTLLEYQTEDYPDEDIKREQVKLNQLYDRFTKKYGLINSRGNNSAFSNDSSYYLLCSLEILDENGNLARKADMFTKRTIKPKTEITSVDNANDALIVSLSEKARVDITFMQKLCNMDMGKMLKDLDGEIFNVPEYGEPNHWVTADEYLSGNVREKLKIAEHFAETDEKFNVNVKYLKEVQPKDLSASEISVRLGSTWIPTEDIKVFIEYLLNPSNYACQNINVHYNEATSEWWIEGKNYDKYNIKATNTYGTGRASAYKIIEDSLNLKDTRIYDYYEDENGKRVAELNKKETAIAQAKQEQIKLAFEEWIWKDPERRERLTKVYNERFNSIRPREYDGSHISFDGMNPEITLRKHQVNAIARILYGGNTLLAHEVGAGKTFEMVAAAMESKRLGLCNKSLFVVPNHIVEQFGQEFLQLYPSANVLVTTKKDFETANRKKFCSRIATGDYDAIIISHSQFEKIPMSVERQVAIIQKQIEDITLGIQDLKNNNGERFSIKQMEKTKKGLETRLAKLNDTSRKDDVVTFEELGVDRIFVDEAHYYKNLFLYTKMRNVGGIAQTEAQKSSDLFMKCRYLDELTGGKGVIFATGTPISNSMVELYTMQRYLQYGELEKRHLQQFDAWASTFGETVTAIELSPEGTGYRAKTRFAKFFNLPELMALFKEVADIQTSEMLNLPVPKANYHNVVIEPSEIQKELVKDLSERAEKIRNRMVDSSVDNMLKITNDGRKLALDQRLTNDMLEDFEHSKVATCADNIYSIWDKTSEDKSAQLVFCDLSTPHNDGKFNVYDDLKTKLIDRGIPEEEIAFIHDANTDARKQELFNKVRRGQVRVLIGSTQKMGAGTNCQDRLIALHDLDCPWRPSDLIQRSGRIIRQGNKNPEVDIYRYVTEGTFDAYLYQLVENKQRFISQIMTSKTPVRFAEDIDETALSYAEIKALAAGNPDIIEKTELDTQVAKLKLLKQNYLSEKYELEDKVIKYYPNEIKRLENRIEDMKEDIEVFNNNNTPDNSFEKMNIKGTDFTERKEAGEKIIEICKSMTNPEPLEIGEYKGFKIILSFDTMDRKFYASMKNNLSYKTELGSDPSGNITRIDNVLNGIETRLSSVENNLEDTKKNYESAKKEIEKPFPQEEELKTKSKRLDELNIKLNLNNKDKEIIDDGNDISDDSQECKKEYER